MRCVMDVCPFRLVVERIVVWVHGVSWDGAQVRTGPTLATHGFRHGILIHHATIAFRALVLLTRSLAVPRCR